MGRASNAWRAQLLYVGYLLIVGRVGKPGTQMREPSYFVLASLLDGPLHGYAIIQRTKELSGGRVRLATGTLYTALDRLTAEGHVELVREEIVNGRVRRSYGLTPPGAGALRAEAARMAEAARLVTDRGRALQAGGGVRNASPA
jgi:PadR family transcriptional regulator, regulatory protein PadR